MGFLHIVDDYVYLPPSEWDELDRKVNSDIGVFERALSVIKVSGSNYDQEIRDKIDSRMVAYLESEYYRNKESFIHRYVNFKFTGEIIKNEVIWDLLDCYSYLNGFSNVRGISSEEELETIIPYAESGIFAPRHKETRYLCFDQYIKRMEANRIIGKSKLETHRVNRIIIDIDNVHTIEGKLLDFVITTDQNKIYFNSEIVTVIPR